MLDLVYGVEIPQQLQELAAGHQRHLAELVERLRTVGMGDDAIEAAVDQLIATYRTQLITAVRAIGNRHV